MLPPIAPSSPSSSTGEIQAPFRMQIAIKCDEMSRPMLPSPRRIYTHIFVTSPVVLATDSQRQMQRRLNAVTIKRRLVHRTNPLTLVNVQYFCVLHLRPLLNNRCSWAFVRSKLRVISPLSGRLPTCSVVDGVQRSCSSSSSSRRFSNRATYRWLPVEQASYCTIRPRADVSTSE